MTHTFAKVPAKGAAGIKPGTRQIRRRLGEGSKPDLHKNSQRGRAVGRSSWDSVRSNRTPPFDFLRNDRAEPRPVLVDYPEPVGPLRKLLFRVLKRDLVRIAEIPGVELENHFIFY